jgi:hypothetical protein
MQITTSDICRIGAEFCPREIIDTTKFGRSETLRQPIDVHDAKNAKQKVRNSSIN